MVSPLREQIALVHGRGVALRVRDHFKKSHDEKNNRPKLACGSRTGARTANVVIGIDLLRNS
jgi:hypothetical protein